MLSLSLHLLGYTTAAATTSAAAAAAAALSGVSTGLPWGQQKT